ncbi:hypothetical protein Clacol_002124 [Clathrus columnatus]|uniref:F-box domain-containing protein n=1 Tax=Clathrus columnatus TaxID=1419009 RepID=A0AAV5A5I4_9AGAM|nr:hypothetical protein Clacol_002124 [Clathrus columnatus]
MHQIFYTSDLLNEIFLYLSRHTRTVTARVCKLWFTHSIQFLWDSASVNDILEIISPFNKLQCRRIEYAALRQALFLRPKVDLFSSKLTVLYWDGLSKHIEYLSPLVTSTLQVLKVQLDKIESPDMLDVFCKTIPLRSPSLRSFQFGFPAANDNTQAVSRSLAQLFLLLSDLFSIQLPYHCITGELFTALSRLSQLQDLSLPGFCFLLMSRDDAVEMLPKRKVDNDEEKGKDIPFRSLEKIHISKSNFMMAEVLRRDIQLPKLVDLTYSDPSPDYTISSPFFESLQRTCPNLKKISISSYHGLPFQAIRSLLKCPALVEIVSDRNVNMRLEDVVTMATDRSSWQVIRLPSAKPLNYQALVPFAKNCPNLYELSLTLDSKLGIPELDNTDVRFSSLTSLHIIGDSSEPTPDFELALFLSKICSKPIKITGYHKLWKTVEKLVNTIITAQLENRRLKDENTILHARKCNHDF